MWGIFTAHENELETQRWNYAILPPGSTVLQYEDDKLKLAAFNINQGKLLLHDNVMKYYTTDTI